MKASRFFSALIAGALVIAAGCGSKEAAPPPPVRIPPEAQRILDNADKSPDAALDLLNETLKDWRLRHPDLPKTVQEFVTSRTLPRLPVPPAGKEFAIDRDRGVVVLVDK